MNRGTEPRHIGDWSEISRRIVRNLLSQDAVREEWERFTARLQQPGFAERETEFCRREDLKVAVPAVEQVSEAAAEVRAQESAAHQDGDRAERIGGLRRLNRSGEFLLGVGNRAENDPGQIS